MLDKYKYRVVQAKWTKTHGSTAFQTEIKVSGTEKTGTLSKVSELISSDVGVSLRSMNITTHDDVFEGTITVLVKDKNYLEAFLKRLQKLKGVIGASRAENFMV